MKRWMHALMWVLFSNALQEYLKRNGIFCDWQDMWGLSKGFVLAVILYSSGASAEEEQSGVSDKGSV